MQHQVKGCLCIEWVNGLGTHGQKVWYATPKSALLSLNLYPYLITSLLRTEGGREPEKAKKDSYAKFIEQMQEWTAPLVLVLAGFWQSKWLLLHDPTRD